MMDCFASPSKGRGENIWGLVPVHVNVSILVTTWKPFSFFQRNFACALLISLTVPFTILKLFSGLITVIALKYCCIKQCSLHSLLYCVCVWQGNSAVGSLNGQMIFNYTTLPTSVQSGFVGMGTGSLGYADFDNVRIASARDGLHYMKNRKLNIR